jgi:predicted dehydrogenase
MEPTYETGDLVLTRRRASYDVGDIVAFRVEGGAQVIHRIVGRDGDRYLTQGDNREQPDHWSPTASEIVGAAWLHLPGAGHLLSTLREPLPFSLAVLAGAFLLPWPRRRDDDPGDPDMATTTPTARHGRRLPPAALPLLVGAVALVGSVAAIWAWSTPTATTTTRVAEVGEHRATLSYGADVEPSALYPDGRLGPVDATDPDADPEALYPALVDQVDVAVSWSATGVDEVSGTWRPVVSLVADDGWRRDLWVGEERDFVGQLVEGGFQLSVSEVVGTVARIEVETGAPVRTALELRADIVATGIADEEPVQLEASPVAGFNVSPAVLVPGEPAPSIAPVEVTGVEAEPRQLGSLTLGTLRWLLVGVVLAAGAAALAGAWELRRQSRRHDRALLAGGVDVVEVSSPPEIHLEVRTADDLVRLVRPGVDVVLHHQADGRHTYAVERNGRVHGWCWSSADADDIDLTVARPVDGGRPGERAGAGLFER